MVGTPNVSYYGAGAQVSIEATALGITGDTGITFIANSSLEGPRRFFSAAHGTLTGLLSDIATVPEPSAEGLAYAFCPGNMVAYRFSVINPFGFPDKYIVPGLTGSWSEVNTMGGIVVGGLPGAMN